MVGVRVVYIYQYVTTLDIEALDCVRGWVAYWCMLLCNDMMSICPGVEWHGARNDNKNVRIKYGETTQKLRRTIPYNHPTQTSHVATPIHTPFTMPFH